MVLRIPETFAIDGESVLDIFKVEVLVENLAGSPGLLSSKKCL